MRNFLPIATRLGLLAITCAAFAPFAASAQTVILVRHAEKAETPKEDPALSDAGKRRAEALADALKGARISAIFTTVYQRTRDTAAPTARQAGLVAEALPIARGGLSEHVAEVVRKLREKPDAVVLVVGHSNTVPAIARALGVAVADMPECEYSRLTIVQSAPVARVIVGRYGEADGSCP